jgi:hypothetical protein
MLRRLRRKRLLNSRKPASKQYRPMARKSPEGKPSGLFCLALFALVEDGVAVDAQCEQRSGQ